MDDMDFLPGIKEKEQTHQGTLEEELDESMKQLAEKNPITDRGDGFFNNVLDGIDFLAGKAKGIGRSIYDDVKGIGDSVVTGIKNTAQRVDNYFEDGEFVTNEQLKSMEVVQRIAQKNFEGIMEGIDPNLPIDEKMKLVMEQARDIYGTKDFIDEQHMLNTYAAVLVELEASLGVSSGDDHVKYGHVSQFVDGSFKGSNTWDCANAVIAGLYVMGYVDSNIQYAGGSEYYDQPNGYAPVTNIEDLEYRHAKFAYSNEADMAGVGVSGENERIPYAIRPYTAYTGMVNPQMIPGSGGIEVAQTQIDMYRNKDGNYVDRETGQEYSPDQIQGLETYQRGSPYSNGIRHMLFDSEHFDYVNPSSSTDKTGLIGLTQRPYGSTKTYQENAFSPVRTSEAHYAGHVYVSRDSNAREIVESTSYWQNGQKYSGLQTRKTPISYQQTTKVYLKPRFYNRNRQRQQNWWD